MVRIRFRRVGARNQPSFRIVAAEKESPRDGRFLEAIGHYNPRTEPATVVVDEARLFHWLSNGAQPSDSVRQTLRPLGTWERWDRYRQGEAIETLLAEAEASMGDVDPRTRRDDLIGKSKKKSKKKAAVKPAEEAEAAAPAAAEAEAESEAEEPAVEAEAEVEEPAMEGETEVSEEDTEEEAAGAEDEPVDESPPDDAPTEVEEEPESGAEAAEPVDEAEEEPAESEEGK